MSSQPRLKTKEQHYQRPPVFGRTPSGRYFVRFLPYLLLVLLLPLLMGCSWRPWRTPTGQLPGPPANLAMPCPPLDLPPMPLMDPERALWEQSIIEKYGVCGSLHIHTVEAWRQAANPAKK